MKLAYFRRLARFLALAARPRPGRSTRPLAAPAVGVAGRHAARCVRRRPAAPPRPTQPDAAHSSRRSKQALARAHAAVVGIEATAVDDARSIATLGQDAQGSGVLIGDDGLVLTIGYLILEAERVDLVAERQPDACRPASSPTTSPPASASCRRWRRCRSAGTARQLGARRRRRAAARGQRRRRRRPQPGAHGLAARRSRATGNTTSRARSSPRRPAPTTAAPALFNADGELVGIGSLIVSDAAGARRPALRGNMFVPVDLLKPILDEMREQRRVAQQPARLARPQLRRVPGRGPRHPPARPTARPRRPACGPATQIVAVDGKPRRRPGDVLQDAVAATSGPSATSRSTSGAAGETVRPAGARRRPHEDAAAGRRASDAARSAAQSPRPRSDFVRQRLAALHGAQARSRTARPPSRSTAGRRCAA